MPSPEPSTVTVLAGFSPRATGAVLDALHRTNPAAIALRYDVRGGLVHRLVLTGDEVLDDAPIGVSHCCVTCTVREDILPTLDRLDRTHPDADLVLVLPPTIEPESIPLSPVAISTIVDGQTFLDDLDSSDELADRGLTAGGGDTRTVADVLARQVEQADTIVVVPDPHAGTYETGRLTALLRSLAPWAEMSTEPGRREHGPLGPPVLRRGLEGLPVHRIAGAGFGVESTLYRARRPFHPTRLDAALSEIVASNQRGRGHLWLASQPDTVLAWESTGAGLAMGAAGQWLAALPDQSWDEVSPGRRTAAALLWDPRFGDRKSVV